MAKKIVKKKSSAVKAARPQKSVTKKASKPKKAAAPVAEAAEIKG